MKTRIHKLKNLIKSHYIISGIVAIVILFIGYKIFFGGKSTAELFIVKKGDVIQKVIVNGKTKPVHAVDLGFEINGKVVRTSVGVGSRVFVGQELASIDASELYANLLKARANLATEEANLAELKKGTRPEELALAKTDVLNAENNISTKILDSFSKSDDAIHNTIDQMWSNAKTSNPQFNLAVTDSQLKTDMITMRIAMEPLLLDWSLHLSVSKENIALAESNLSKVKSFIDMVAVAVNTASPSNGISQTTLDSYKSDISVARTTISTAMTNMATAESTLLSAEGELTLKQNGNTPETIAAQEAKVMQNQAGVQSAEAQLAKTTLRSPQNGIVTRADAKVGEIVTSGKFVISIISDSDLEIESNVSEINIGKVAVGNTVAISFDAFPNENFKGVVTYIEPAETVVDGVVNYKVTVALSEKYPNIKSGLTSKLEIQTAVKNDVFVAPQYALVKEDSKTFVQKQNGKVFEKTPVEIGLVGQDGMVEIISGVSEGDVISAVAK